MSEKTPQYLPEFEPIERHVPTVAELIRDGKRPRFSTMVIHETIDVDPEVLPENRHTLTTAGLELLGNTAANAAMSTEGIVQELFGANQSRPVVLTAA